jgi:hypothetical protein
MSADLWYRVSDDHPGPLVQVRAVVCMYAGQRQAYDAHIIVSRGGGAHAKTWAQWVKGKRDPVPLPAHAVVTLWQPQHPDKWRAALPEPIVGTERQMWSERMAFTAVADAEAADLASEMERDRQLARDVGNASEDDADDDVYEPREWRDASWIRYEPPGSITPKMAEARIMRAVAMCGHGRGLTLRSKTFSDVLAKIASRANGQEYATNDFVARLQALPADHADFDTAMSWFVALSPRPISRIHTVRADWDFNNRQDLLIYRALDVPLSYEQIGNMVEFRMTKQGVRDLYARTMRVVTKVANGIPVMLGDGKTAQEQLDALRKRNIQAKLQG